MNCQKMDLIESALKCYFERFKGCGKRSNLAVLLLFANFLKNF